MKRFELEGDEVTIARGRVYCGPEHYLAGMVDQNGYWEAWLPPARSTGKASSMKAAAILIARAWQAWRDLAVPASEVEDSDSPDGWPQASAA